ncbi:c-type cytochrome [Aquabacterium sp.]|uniref:c-type cytochrome n=1 Tax=Aquabacterium sp. TaxID=1872578 RepID=UPI0024875B10|nr:c-type cytochrome [Aquabacterium sp.]MDI1260689.1 c-type cytochrome [Aquabacterium sp.]
MNKRQARLFAIGATVISAAVFIGMTIDSHRQFATLTHSDQITPAVIRGKNVWHKNNCINCHTVFGEGAYYAPDLTKITKLRGEAYLKAYLHDPSQFYDEKRHRRLMPKQDLSATDITDLIAFLDWVSNVDNQGWPPRPLLVTGASISPTGPALSVVRPVSGAENPIALGESVFRTSSPACVACHSTTPDVNMAGPSLAGLTARTEKLLASGGYKGSVKTVEGYIRESITHPSAHVLPGPMYSASGVSFMPATFAKDLPSAQIDQLVAYLTSLK